MVPLINLHVKIQVSTIVRGLRLFDSAFTLPLPQKAKGANTSEICDYWGFGNCVSKSFRMFKVWHASWVDISFLTVVYEDEQKS